MNRIIHTLYMSFLCLLCVATSSHALSPVHAFKTIAQRYAKTCAALATGATSAATAYAYAQLPENNTRTRAHVNRFYPKAPASTCDAIAHTCYRKQATEKSVGFGLVAAGALQLAQTVGYRATPRAALCCSALSGMVTAYFFPTWYDTAVEMHAIRAARRA